MHYLVYKITNVINCKSYIGCHQTKNKNDGYMGSGKLIIRAINKYGIENFTKEIMFECTSKEEMFAKERESVTLGKHSYNLKLGGEGGFSYINANGLSDHASNSKIANSRFLTLLKDREWRASWVDAVKHGSKNSSAVKAHIAQLKINHPAPFKGKLHSDETKSVMSEKAKARTTNSQSGSMWITDGTSNMKIKADSDVPDGWSRGRVNVHKN